MANIKYLNCEQLKIIANYLLRMYPRKVIIN